jgi:DNA topoisomerase-3
MQITMDKYKTSQLGQALKKVYHGTMSVEDSVKLAEAEIAEVFDKKAESNLSLDSETGFFGDVVASCPLCKRDVKRFRTFYGCTGYKEGCKFSVNISICGRAISVANLKLLTENGRTAVIQGFVSARTKKTFDAALKLEEGRAVFDFERKESPRLSQTGQDVPLPVWDGEGPPPPDDPPPGY